ncbi:peptidoglycan editing factor PgeF [Anoxybacteroides amylolyticum]|uniref:Purine nucleoside phosphorylase n=1 Tax=Anoxybacteroides amylolyticum TaxID=294699 RepID=A0A160F6C3_9BACL|nr:peptidoglycan editing factor PgeF [Anoxybacillus amylolyticus]ANB61642.1 ylmd protein [Anoxybacillus amylolyticus]
MSEIFHPVDESLLMLRWSNVIAGFTTKQGGFSQAPFATFNLGLHVGDEAIVVEQNRRKLAEFFTIPLEQWVCCEQTHGSRIEKVTARDAGKGTVRLETAIADTDGLYTDEAGILLTLCFADCVPLYFFAPTHGMIGLAHAGWKGTVKNIAGNMVQRFRDEGIMPEEVMVAIGPAIGACCYVVDNRVIDAVQNVLGTSETLPFYEMSVGQYALDLKELNRLLLIKEGVQHIEVSNYCTSCETNVFFSHRRDNGQTGRMMAFIGRKEEGNVCSRTLSHYSQQY